MLSEGFTRRLALLLRYADDVFGVMFVYYRRNYKLSHQDERAIEILAAHAALGMRVGRSFQETCAEIGHDFNRQISRLASRVSLLRAEINKAPYLSEMFWNSGAGDLFADVVIAKDDITRFATEFQEFGKVVALRRKPLELGDFVERQIHRVRRESITAASSGQSAIEIQYECRSKELVADVDEGYIARAIDAVIHNSIQALSETTTSGQPYISVVTRGATDHAGRSCAVISITDSGPGVPVEKKEAIFRLFYTTRVDVGGNGIGLANARRYVELHGGILREVGHYNQGARFVFMLPLRIPPPIGLER